MNDEDVARLLRNPEAVARVAKALNRRHLAVAVELNEEGRIMHSFMREEEDPS